MVGDRDAERTPETNEPGKPVARYVFGLYARELEAWQLCPTLAGENYHRDTPVAVFSIRTRQESRNRAVRAQRLGNSERLYEYAVRRKLRAGNARGKERLLANRNLLIFFPGRYRGIAITPDVDRLRSMASPLPRRLLPANVTTPGEPRHPFEKTASCINFLSATRPRV